MVLLHCFRINNFPIKIQINPPHFCFMLLRHSRWKLFRLFLKVSSLGVSVSSKPTEDIFTVLRQSRKNLRVEESLFLETTPSWWWRWKIHWETLKSSILYFIAGSSLLLAIAINPGQEKMNQLHLFIQHHLTPEQMSPSQSSPGHSPTNDRVWRQAVFLLEL